jgi:hypothetical protein
LPIQQVIEYLQRLDGLPQALSAIDAAQQGGEYQES